VRTASRPSWTTSVVAFVPRDDCGSPYAERLILFVYAYACSRLKERERERERKQKNLWMLSRN
jgi:uncharacterized membrane protein